MACSIAVTTHTLAKRSREHITSAQLYIQGCCSRQKVYLSIKNEGSQSGTDSSLSKPWTHKVFQVSPRDRVSVGIKTTRSNPASQCFLVLVARLNWGQSAKWIHGNVSNGVLCCVKQWAAVTMVYTRLECCQLE